MPALASFLFQLTCTGTGTASGPFCGDPFWPFWAAANRKRVAIDYDGFVFFLIPGLVLFMPGYDFAMTGLSPFF